jgi:hypothetical protein
MTDIEQIDFAGLARHLRDVFRGVPLEGSGAGG